MSYNRLKKRILAGVDPKEFYGLVFSGDLGQNQLCPFHEDTNPSFSVDIKEGKFFCHACRVHGTSVIDFYCKFLHLDFHEGMDSIREKYLLVDEHYIRNLQLRLKQNPEALSNLLSLRGWSEETIDKFRIGWNGDRYSIPIVDEQGGTINVLFYMPGQKPKVIRLKRGTGHMLFPMQFIQGEELMIVEGEPDAILAHQLDYCAITAGGAGIWDPDDCHLLNNKHVVLCLDNDEAGNNGRDRIVQSIYDHCRLVSYIDIPVEPGVKDLTDYVRKYGAEKFAELHKGKKTWSHQAINAAGNGDPTWTEVHLSDASKSLYYDKRIQIKALVVGKDLAPYMPPKKVEVTCHALETGACGKGCPREMSDGTIRLDLSNIGREVLKLINCTDDQLKGAIKLIARVTPDCKIRVKVIEAFNIEDIKLIPEAGMEINDAPYVVRRAFYVGHGLDTNRTYSFHGTTVPEPWTQLSTHILYNAHPLVDSIDTFNLSPERRQEIQEVFRGKTKQEVMLDINNDLADHVTMIYHRASLHLMVNLTYFSVLSFVFNNEPVRKGWIESLVVGDSRTGKGYVVERLRRHYRLGEIASGESSSFAGLVGGLQQIQGKRWTLTWGLLPQNDRRLVVIDETSGVSVDDISRLSRIRSEGMAELTKIQTERTNARVRLIWMSNSRSGSPLLSYGNGVEVLKELIGRNEDIARFDLILFITSNEVPLEEINKYKEKAQEGKYKAGLLRDMILFAWSRKEDQIVFTDEATRMILDRALILGNKYKSDFPICEGAEVRIKLARLSAAIAAHCFNAEEDKLIVDSECVENACAFQEYLWERPAFGFNTYCEAYRSNHDIKNEDRLISDLRRMKNPAAFIDFLLGLPKIQIQDIQDQLGLLQYDAKKIISDFVQQGAIRRDDRYYVKTPGFTELLKRARSTLWS